MIEKIEVTISVSKSKEDTKRMSLEALKNRLFVSNSGWQLNLFFHRIIKLESNADISLAYIDNKPIGVALLLYDIKPEDSCEEKSQQISVFVRKKYRRLGVGTKLVNSLLKYKSNVFARQGIFVSESFYKKQNIFLAEW